MSHFGISLELCVLMALHGEKGFLAYLFLRHTDVIFLSNSWQKFPLLPSKMVQKLYGFQIQNNSKNRLQTTSK